MQQKKDLDSKINEYALRELFDELAPKSLVIRFFSVIILFSILFEIMEIYEVSATIWVVSSAAVFILNLFFWAKLREIQFSRFKKARKAKVHN